MTAMLYDKLTALLVNEIEKLRAEIERLNSELTDALTDLDSARQDNASLTEGFKDLRAALQNIRQEAKLTEETTRAALVERVAKAIAAVDGHKLGQMAPATTSLYFARADAAIALVLEEAAKVADALEDSLATE